MPRSNTLSNARIFIRVRGYAVDCHLRYCGFPRRVPLGSSRRLEEHKPLRSKRLLPCISSVSLQFLNHLAEKVYLFGLLFLISCCGSCTSGGGERRRCLETHRYGHQRSRHYGSGNNGGRRPCFGTIRKPRRDSTGRTEAGQRQAKTAETAEEGDPQYWRDFPYQHGAHRVGGLHGFRRCGSGPQTHWLISY